MVCDRRGRVLEQFAVGELLHQLPVSIEEVQLRQLTPVHPTNLAEDAILHLAFLTVDQEEVELHRIPVGVAVLQLRNLATYVRANPQFLVELAL